MRWALQSPWISAFRYLLDHVMAGGSPSSWTCQLERQMTGVCGEHQQRRCFTDKEVQKSAYNPLDSLPEKNCTRVGWDKKRQGKKKTHQLERNKLDHYWSEHRVGWHHSPTRTSLNTRGIKLSWRPWFRIRAKTLLQ